MNQSSPTFQSALDESAFRALWNDKGLDTLTPAEMARCGGALADRLAWVFISGYQAAVRYVFPEIPGGGWAAFAASEDQKNPEENPPLLIENGVKGLILNGTKSWVAQSRHVDHLVVTARDKTEAVLSFVVDAHAPGISLSHRDEASFLQAMSQGYARFEGFVVTGDQLPDDRIKLFMRSESRFIMLACSAFLHAHAVEQDGQLKRDAAMLERDFFVVATRDHITSRELADLDDRLQALGARFSDTAMSGNIPDWEADKSLLAMYSKGIQARAAKAS